MQTKRILIAAFAVLSAVALLDFATPGAGGFGDVVNQPFIRFDLSLGKELPPDFESPGRLEPAVVAEGGRVSVDGTIGDLEVREAPGSEAVASYTVQVWGKGDLEAFAGSVRPRWVAAGDGVRLVVDRPAVLPGGVRGFHVDVVLSVPEGRGVSVDHRGNVTVDGLSGELKLDFAGGRAEVRGVTAPVSVRGNFGLLAVAGVAGPLSVDHAGGGVSVRDIAGDVSGTMRYGEVTVAGVGGDVAFNVTQGAGTFERIDGDLELSASLGSFDVAGVKGFVDADLAMGDMSVAGLAGGADLSVEFGDLSVQLAPGGGWSVDAVVELGELESAYPLLRSESGPRTEAKGVIGDGSNPLSVRVRRGAAKLR